MMPPARMETCQNCDSSVPVDDRGRVAWHTIAGEVTEHIGMLQWCGCRRSRHPSREELARRKAARAAKRAGGAYRRASARRSGRARRLSRASARVREPHRGLQAGRAVRSQPGDQDAPPRVIHGLDADRRRVESRPDYRTQRCARCRICGAKLGSLVLGTLSLPARDHLAQCALEYLARLRPAISASVETRR